MLKWIIGILIIVAALSFLSFKMLNLAKKECGLCLSFQGQRKCTVALGPTDEDAIEEAKRSLCAQLAAGVTEVLACQRLAPEEVLCGEPKHDK